MSQQNEYTLKWIVFMSLRRTQRSRWGQLVPYVATFSIEYIMFMLTNLRVLASQVEQWTFCGRAFIDFPSRTCWTRNLESSLDRLSIHSHVLVVPGPSVRPVRMPRGQSAIRPRQPTWIPHTSVPTSPSRFSRPCRCVWKNRHRERFHKTNWLV